MRTSTNHLGSNPDADTVNQYIAEQLLNGKTIRGYGKSQHGMNGKDADLDAEGQCVIDSIEIVDPVGADTMFIELHINRYANICTPTDDNEDREEMLQECAENIVMSTYEYRGEWTGSDYWCFSYYEVIRVPLFVEEYEEPNLDALADRCAAAVNYSPAGKEFEQFASDLNRSIDELHNLTNDELGL
jgi:hypothetical protein